MKWSSYFLISILPPVLFSVIILPVALILHRKFTNFHRLVAANTFRKIIRKKKNAKEKITWQVGDIEIEEGSKVLSKVMYRVCWLFVMKLLLIWTIFFQLLLLQISDDCDPDEKTKDCFELKFWETGRLPNAPINCSSTVFVNGSVEVICYEVGFHIITAVGVSYGVLETLNTVFELLATLMLMKKTKRCVYTVQTLVVLSYVVFSIIIAVVQATSLRLSLETVNTPVFIFEMSATVLMAIQFAFVVPWKDIIKENNKMRSTREQALALDKIVIES